MLKIAFVCARNACLSQMAEALGNGMSGHGMECVSAGISPSNQMDLGAVRFMKHFYGLDMEKAQKTKSISELKSVDVLVAINCAAPALPADRRVQWQIEEPNVDPMSYIRACALIRDKIFRLREQLREMPAPRQTAARVS